MKVLVTIVGTGDPWVLKNKQPVEGLRGPILNLLSEIKDFDKVILLHTKRTMDNVIKTIGEITRLDNYVDEKVSTRELEIDNINDNEEILRELRTHIDHIVSSGPNDDYSMVVSSGTKAMHFCWNILAMTGDYERSRYIRLISPEKGVLDDDSSIFKEVRYDYSGACEVRFLKEKRKPSLPRSSWQKIAEDVHIVGSHPDLMETLEDAAGAAEMGSNVLIRGESGTGKELLAKFIHKCSSRKDGPFNEVDMGAIPETLIESELFGHEAGAFTDARRKNLGYFVRSDKGTLFLDEIGNIGPNIQVKILRAIQEKEIQPVGGKTTKVDVHIICATNANLEDYMAKKEFREDLYYRIAVSIIKIPPLRARKSDIDYLVDHFVNKLNERTQQRKSVSKGARRMLQQYHWPGNIRELENALERAYGRSRAANIVGTEDFRDVKEKLKKNPKGDICNNNE